MNLLARLVRPTRIAHAHCDGPCGVYDPASARIAAEAVLSFEKKVAALGNGQDDATVNTRTRFILLKEQQAGAGDDTTPAVGAENTAEGSSDESKES